MANDDKVYRVPGMYCDTQEYGRIIPALTNSVVFIGDHKPKAVFLPEYLAKFTYRAYVHKTTAIHCTYYMFYVRGKIWVSNFCGGQVNFQVNFYWPAGPLVTKA